MSKSFAPLPPADYLRDRLTYDKILGDLRWKHRPPIDFATYNAYRTWNSRFPGKLVGWKQHTNVGKHYICLDILGTTQLAHRIIWKMVTGNDPIRTIDHENGDGLDNHWNNLREATQAEQMKNKQIRSDNTIGFKNVRRLLAGRFQAYISIGGKFKSLGTYETAKEAHEVYCAVAKDIHGEFFNPG